jgi:choline dehydrogenase-like flavoprotein
VCLQWLTGFFFDQWLSFSSDAGIIETQIPFTAPNILTNTSLLWNYLTVPQENLNNRILTYQRGRLLGGSSSISMSYPTDILQLLTTLTDFLIYTRGSRDDFDRFADVTGDSIWSWDEMFPFALKACVV